MVAFNSNSLIHTGVFDLQLHDAVAYSGVILTYMAPVVPLLHMEDELAVSPDAGAPID